MDNFVVKLYARAYRDLDEIYSYIANILLDSLAAENTVSALEKAIYSLEQLPERGPHRRVGIYTNKD